MASVDRCVAYTPRECTLLSLGLSSCHPGSARESAIALSEHQESRGSRSPPFLPRFSVIHAACLTYRPPNDSAASGIRLGKLNRVPSLGHSPCGSSSPCRSKRSLEAAFSGPDPAPNGRSNARAALGHPASTLPGKRLVVRAVPRCERGVNRRTPKDSISPPPRDARNKKVLPKGDTALSHRRLACTCPSIRQAVCYRTSLAFLLTC